MFYIPLLTFVFLNHISLALGGESHQYCGYQYLKLGDTIALIPEASYIIARTSDVRRVEEVLRKPSSSGIASAQREETLVTSGPRRVYGGQMSDNYNSSRSLIAPNGFCDCYWKKRDDQNNVRVSCGGCIKSNDTKHPE
ncbi:hypothetical protein O181_042120 [Austropuccinia psidii MF-1]|uniref:Uncharacterized protein n=1 Tax=Austropuccinia psidii MF-1 TaxID=1389203 RepID=A0A9Q3HHU9_9BASI|nr:hypothetical protein [Austropuccinia psidii MF-1]